MLKKPITHIVFYLISYLNFYLSINIAPSSLAGPGLDIPVVLFILVGSGALFISAIINNCANFIIWIYVIIIYVIGFGIFIWLLNMPIQKFHNF